MDILYKPARKGLELKKSPRAVRPSQHDAFDDLWDDTDWKYVFGED